MLSAVVLNGWQLVAAVLVMKVQLSPCRLLRLCSSLAGEKTLHGAAAGDQLPHIKLNPAPPQSLRRGVGPVLDTGAHVL